MTELAAGPSGEEHVDRILEQRRLGLELLDVYGKDYRTDRKVEDVWRSIRLGVWLAPLVTAIILVGTGAKKIDSHDKELLEAGSVAAALIGFGTSWHKMNQSTANAKSTGVRADELRIELGIDRSPWISEALTLEIEDSSTGVK